jgi:hypothetical protein
MYSKMCNHYSDLDSGRRVNITKLMNVISTIINTLSQFTLTLNFSFTLGAFFELALP